MQDMQLFSFGSFFLSEWVLICVLLLYLSHHWILWRNIRQPFIHRDVFYRNLWKQTNNNRIQPINQTKNQTTTTQITDVERKKNLIIDFWEWRAKRGISFRDQLCSYMMLLLELRHVSLFKSCLQEWFVQSTLDSAWSLVGNDFIHKRGIEITISIVYLLFFFLGGGEWGEWL